VFGVSFSEILVIGLIALFVVGPRKLPTMLGTLGKWVGKLRHMSTEVRTQIGMDEFLRKEGLQGGLNELRGLMRGGLAGAAMSSVMNPSNSNTATGSATRPLFSDTREVADDRTREYPPEGPDAYGAVPDDLIDDEPNTPADAAKSTDNVAQSAAPAPSDLAGAPSPVVADGNNDKADA
jgi:sec-independent protein translocase protein TatB